MVSDLVIVFLYEYFIFALTEKKLEFGVHRTVGILLQSACTLFLLCFFRPDLFNYDSVLTKPVEERLDHAFTVAQEQLGVDKLLDPEGTLQN